MRAIDSAVGERTNGPVLARSDGSRLDRHAAGRILRRLAKRAGIDKAISPHSLRHAAITAALDAGCSLRDVQDFARHADPSQTHARLAATTAPAAHSTATPPTSSPLPRRSHGRPVTHPSMVTAAESPRAEAVMLCGLVVRPGQHNCCGILPLDDGGSEVLP
jgi:hypothetical protein